jgi:hypothetical protein
VNPKTSKTKIDKPKKALIKWLLDSDPSIRWQVMRDLTDESADAIAAERARIATEGWGAELLKRQNAEGTWGDDGDFPLWNSTLATMQLLWAMGLDPKSEQARKMTGRLRDNVSWVLDKWWNLKSGPERGGSPYFEGEVEPCINGRVLGFGAYFGEPNEKLAEKLLGEQLKDGGWNCEVENGSVRSSFHTTICVLEGLLEYEKAKGDAAVKAARLRGEEYLIERRMLRSLSTGKPITMDKQSGKRTKWTHFSFPTTWHYDLLRGLDYLRSAGAKPDERLADAVALVANKQHQNGRWPRQNIHKDPVQLEMEGARGTASRWNTLRAMRVLDWYSSQN